MSDADLTATGNVLERPVGHDTVVARLERLAAIPSGPAAGPGAGVPHAALLVGPAGVGKYRTALWWAARLKCERAAGTICDPACPSCLQIAAGSHPDLRTLEPLEEGKQIGIDPVRHLIQSMSLKPLRPGPRVAIVREAHLLGVHAQSAMLKLLEEPPGLAVIVLVTDNLAALLPTIRSRCQTFRFGPLENDAVESLLLEHGREPAAARQAAALARGSAGRALACSAEQIEDRDELVLGFERLRTGEAQAVEPLTAELVERRKKGRGGLDTLYEWGMKKVEASLGYGGHEESGTLAAILHDLSADDTRALLEHARRIHFTIGALDQNANARLAIRDLLLSIRAR